MTPIEAVVFDLDGTLLDHSGAVRAALQLWLPSMGAAASAGLLRAWLDAEERHLPAWRSREISFAEQRRRRLRDFLPLIGADFDEADLDRFFAGYLEHDEASWTAFDDAAPTGATTSKSYRSRTAGLNAVHLDRIGAGLLDEPHRIVSLSELPSLVRNPTGA